MRDRGGGAFHTNQSRRAATSTARAGYIESRAVQCEQFSTEPFEPPPPSEDGPHPVFTRRWDPLDFTYTDGSKKDGCTTLGAAVFHARSSTSYYIDATGEAETNTINRAELVAIHAALTWHRDTLALDILTDSLCSIQKI